MTTNGDPRNDRPTRPIDTMTIDPETRIISGTGTYVDGSEYFGPADFEAERGVPFVVFADREPEPVGADDAIFETVRRAR